MLTIKQNQRQNIRRDGFIGDAKNVFEFSVGNCKCFLRAQAFSLDGNRKLIREMTLLEDDYLQDFEHWFTDFGRVKVKEGRKRILKYIV